MSGQSRVWFTEADVQRVVDEAPPLSPAQVNTLALIFSAARRRAAESVPAAGGDVLDEILGGE